MEKNAMTMFKQTIIYNHENIWVKPVCDFFKLDVRNQHKRIKNDPVLSKLVGKNTLDYGHIDKNGRILLTKAGFIRWVQIINPNTMEGKLKEKFVQYQAHLLDYMYGTTISDDVAKIAYFRLKKLRSLYGKIGSEIQKSDRIVKHYVDGHLGSLNIFKELESSKK